jgi:hypothetical protein
MPIMPGRIFSTLSFSLYSLVYSSRELKKYFATPLRSPLSACHGTWWGKFAFTGSLIPAQKMHANR